MKYHTTPVQVLASSARFLRMIGQELTSLLARVVLSHQGGATSRLFSGDTMHTSEVVATVEAANYLDFVEQQMLTVITKEEAQSLSIETGVFSRDDVLLASKRFGVNRNPQGVLTKLAIKKLARKARKR
jgi:hypothetical protein